MPITLTIDGDEAIDALLRQNGWSETLITPDEQQIPNPYSKEDMVRRLIKDFITREVDAYRNAQHREQVAGQFLVNVD